MSTPPKPRSPEAQAAYDRAAEHVRSLKSMTSPDFTKQAVTRTEYDALVAAKGSPLTHEPPHAAVCGLCGCVPPGEPIRCHLCNRYGCEGCIDLNGLCTLCDDIEQERWT